MLTNNKVLGTNLGQRRSKLGFWGKMGWVPESETQNLGTPY